MAHSRAMPAQIDTRKAHLVRNHRDLVAIYTWINGERALVLVPAHRPGAPWFVVMENSAFVWDDSDPANVSNVARRATKACEVLGIEATQRNVVRVASIIIDGIPDLVRMPSAPPPTFRPESFGALTLKVEGEAIAQEDIRVEDEGATYG